MNWNELCDVSLYIIKKFIDIFDFDDILHGAGSGLTSINQIDTSNQFTLSPKQPIKRYIPSINSPKKTQNKPETSKILNFSLQFQLIFNFFCC